MRFCTQLKGKASWFLPFDKGWNDGAGNPPNPNGLKTDYLWREVLTQQFHDILPGSSIGWVHDDAEAIHDRVGGARMLHLGYRGTQQLFDRITNALIEAKQEASTVGYFYM